MVGSRRVVAVGEMLRSIVAKERDDGAAIVARWARDARAAQRVGFYRNGLEHEAAAGCDTARRSLRAVNAVAALALTEAAARGYAAADAWRRAL
jgi:hypothetical protein